MAALRYKVGDKVIVRKREDLLKEYSPGNPAGDPFCGGQSFVQPMNSFCGKVATIQHVGRDMYILIEDVRRWAWTDEMFESDLPKFYAIKRPEDAHTNPLWGEYIRHLSKIEGAAGYSGHVDDMFYGTTSTEGGDVFNGTTYTKKLLPEQILLTLEEWDSLFNKQTITMKYELTRPQLLEIRSRVDCSTIQEKINNYLTVFFDNTDTEPFFIKEGDIEDLLKKGSPGDLAIVKEYLQLEPPRNFKAGEKVFSPAWGVGKVDHQNQEDPSSSATKVTFGDTIRSYNTEGRYYNSDENPTLFKANEKVTFQLVGDKVKMTIENV